VIRRSLWRNRVPRAEPRRELPSVSLQRLTAAAPARSMRATLWTLLALVAALLVWVFSARLDIVAVASGKLVPASQVKVVQAAEAGVVRELLVAEGERVRAGQVLLRMDPTLAAADRDQVEGELLLKRIVVRGIDADLAGRSFVARRGEPPALFVQVQSQFAARRQTKLDAQALERQVAERAAFERVAAERQRDKLRQTLPAYQAAAEAFARLKRDGFVGDLAANDRQRELMEKTQDLAAQEATIDALSAAIAQSERRLEQIESNWRADLLRERVEAQAIVQRLKQERAKSGFRVRQLDVLAPQDGVVKDLAVHAPGAVVQAAGTLLRLVPHGDALTVEAMLANEDVGFAEVGQLARVKLAAYPFQKYGMLTGRLAQISADTLDIAETQKETGAVAPLTYRAVIALDGQRLVLPGGRRLELAPGMAATVEIHQGTRSVMEYLLSPVQRVAGEAARER